MKPHFVTFDRNPSFLFVAGSPDILICGNCREMFTDLVDMIDHKKYYCKLRFTCKCDMTQDGVDCINGAQCGGGLGEGRSRSPNGFVGLSLDDMTILQRSA